jgi:hypothetical protein
MLQDLPLAARALKLIPAGVRWDGTPEEFGTEYLAALRILTSGPLAGLRRIIGGLTVYVDPEIRSIAAWESRPITGQDESSASDRVVTTPSRLEEQRGRSWWWTTEVQSPHMLAVRWIIKELDQVLSDGGLSEEGPDLIYARLAQARLQFTRLLQRTADWDNRLRVPPAMGQSAEDLLLAYSEVVREIAVDAPKPVDPATSAIVLDHATRSVMLAIGTRPDRSRPWDPSTFGRNSFSGAVLVELVQAARGHGIAGLPLHPLGIRPIDNADAFLSYPDRLDQLHANQLVEYIRRFEEAFRRSARYIVEHDLSGLPGTKAAFEVRERVELRVEQSEGGDLFGVTVHNRSDPIEGPDDVLLVTPGGRGTEWDWGWSAFTFHYSTLSERVYRELRSAVAKELSGQNALGEQAL